jgi:hypothetical protein
MVMRPEERSSYARSAARRTVWECRRTGSGVSPSARRRETAPNIKIINPLQNTVSQIDIRHTRSNERRRLHHTQTSALGNAPTSPLPTPDFKQTFTRTLRCLRSTSITRRSAALSAMRVRGAARGRSCDGRIAWRLPEQRTAVWPDLRASRPGRARRNRAGSWEESAAARPMRPSIYSPRHQNAILDQQ